MPSILCIATIQWKIYSLSVFAHFCCCVFTVATPNTHSPPPLSLSPHSHDNVAAPFVAFTLPPPSTPAFFRAPPSASNNCIGDCTGARGRECDPAAVGRGRGRRTELDQSAYRLNPSHHRLFPNQIRRAARASSRKPRVRQPELGTASQQIGSTDFKG